MNYGGHYRSTPETLLAQQDAEDLDVVYNLIVNKEERIPDIGYFRRAATPIRRAASACSSTRRNTTRVSGATSACCTSRITCCCPTTRAYRHTALASPWPHNGAIADLAHAQGALVGYVHSRDLPDRPAEGEVLSYELPADVAHGKVDYLEVMGFSDHHITAGIWYRLLNLGFRLPAGAGTDAMANYASLRGPIGLVRVFLDTGGERTPAALKRRAEVRAHVSSATAPLLGLTIDGKRAGRHAAAGAGQARRCASRCARRSRWTISSSCRTAGSIKAFKLDGRPHALRLERRTRPRGAAAGWCCAPSTTQPHPWVLDLYPYATTSPIYLDAPAAAPRRRTPRTSSPGWIA